MLEDSTHKASSVEVVEASKHSLRRPLVVKGAFAEREECRRLDDDFAHSHPSPVPRGASYLPDWAQDAEIMPIPSGTEQDLGSPEDIKDVLRMGITQEMRVSSVEALFSKDTMLIHPD
jgi:choline transport protein